MNYIRILSAEDVREALPMAVAIAGMKEAYGQLSAGTADVPLRTRLSVPERDGTALFMPAYLPDSDDMAIKLVSVFPQNAQHDLPIIHAAVLVVDTNTGRPLALLEGGALTAIRTGAGGGAATDLLARPEASVVAVLGSGTQARAGLEAVCSVRQVDEVRVYSPTTAHAEQFVVEMVRHDRIPRNIIVADSPQTAVRDADIVYAATTSNEPVFDGRDLKPGAHVVGVGSYTPQMQEIDAYTVTNARVVVDSRRAVLEEAGDLLVPIAAGEITADHIRAEIGEIVNGTAVGRENDEQITFFKSVGVAVQDVVAARIALKNAVDHDLGTLAPF